MFRKRKSPAAAAAAETLADAASAAKRPCVNGAGDAAADIGIAANDNNNSSSGSPAEDQDDECLDDKESVRNTLIVRLPTQAPNAPATSVIIIDDSDDDIENETVPTSSDVKPDVQQLDRQLVEAAASAGDVDTADHKPAVTDIITDQPSRGERERIAAERADAPEQSRPALGHQAVDTVEARSSGCEGAENVAEAATMQPVASGVSSTPTLSSPPHRSSKSAPSTARTLSPAAVRRSLGKKLLVDKDQQTEVVMREVGVQSVDACRGSTEHRRKLESLRSNVLQLLKTIVPTLTCNNLEFVDELVVEMVRVNAESSELDD